MALFKQLELKDSIEIKTPEKIWAFFTDLEKNYKTWHPEDHVLFKWTEGKPMESGSKFYAEEYVMGKIKEYEGTISESVPNRRIVFKCSFPISIVSPKFEWLIEPKGLNSVFTAKTYMRCERFFRILMRKGFDILVEVGKKHMKEEGENLKEILESENY